MALNANDRSIAGFTMAGHTLVHWFEISIPIVLVVWLGEFSVGVAPFAIQPFYQNAVAIYTPPDARGLSYGYTYLAEFGFGSASIAVGGFVLAERSQTLFFAVIAGFGVAGGLLASALVVGGGRFTTVDDTLEANADD